MKLYLGSFAQTRFDDAADVSRPRSSATSRAATGAPVTSTLAAAADFARSRIAELAGESHRRRCRWRSTATRSIPSLLARGRRRSSRETLRTDLFRSVCPVTGQPDYASIAIAYRGPRIDRAGLLRYLVSYRLHAGFHEHCVERIFVDLVARVRGARR